ncbi:50S ribosomal protein L23 [Candidatus Uhrbacteria bacterium]|nr:50S ribosomal protein L23 [Candidatus Uhrbacteria bacterium]
MAWNVFKKKGSTPDASSASAAVPVDTQKEQRPAVQKVVPAKKVSRFSVSADAIFIHPLATEKALAAVRHDVYAFQVRTKATKIDIKKAFANLYGVMPTGVRTMRMDGKRVRFGRREGTRASWKKALITVPKGTTIDIS